MIESKPGPSPDTTIIEGKVFADEFLRLFCNDIPEGEWFQISKREKDGAIVMVRYEDEFSPSRGTHNKQQNTGRTI